MPRDRWILFTGGPRLGPAVLFWSYCLIVVVVAIGLGRTSLTPLKTRHWLLLGLGLTQVHPLVAVMIVGWLLALGYRGAKTPTGKWFRFNVIQIGLGFWTLAALMGLYIAVQRGLLGIPDMQIAGNNATAFTLNWTLDRIDWALPRPWALAVPKWIFNVVMLFWALWLAFSLLGWLRWGWQCLCHGGMWKKSGYKWTGRGVSKKIETAQSDKSLKGAPDA